jgi:hypothetical protein
METNWPSYEQVGGAMKFLFGLIIFTTTTSALAEKNDVIDLGSLEVKGEVRQPPIRFYQPKTIPITVIKNVSEMNFKSFEQELTRPSASSSSAASKKKDRK